MSLVPSPLRGGKPLNPDLLGCIRQVADTAILLEGQSCEKLRSVVIRLPTCQVLSHVPVR